MHIGLLSRWHIYHFHSQFYYVLHKGLGAIRAIFGPTPKFHLICHVVSLYHRPSENNRILGLARLFCCLATTKMAELNSSNMIIIQLQYIYIWNWTCLACSELYTCTLFKYYIINCTFLPIHCCFSLATYLCPWQPRFVFYLQDLILNILKQKGNLRCKL
mgnify:CR=1 FL=1